jgi:integrase
MARGANRLSARKVDALKEPGMHADGDGLYLCVKPSGAKSWVFVFQWHGKRKEMGLGSVSVVTLAEARQAANEARRTVANGTNPIDQRKTERAKQAEHSFGSFADELIDGLEPGFKNAKHIAQWRMTLRTYAAPLRDKRLDQIETQDVLTVLKPIWQQKAETASRVRGRIERVLDAAKAKGLRTGENPARWRGHLDNLLPKRDRLTRGHHKALPYAELADFMAKLRAVDSLSALALEWAILSACRSGEVLGATWSEIDRKGAVWAIPAQRMKAKHEHRVPLTGRMLELLERLEPLRMEGDYLFPGTKRGKPLSGMSMTMQLCRMGFGHVTVHGFRSAFRDWAGEETGFPREVAEAALAHVVGDATERAYRRGDALKKRHELMEAWAQWCERSTAADVVSLQGRKRDAS